MDRLRQWFVSLFQSPPLYGSFSFQCASQEEAQKLLRSPYLLVAMNPLLEVNRPTAENMKREESLKPGHRFTVQKTEEGLLSVTYKNIYPFAGPPSAIQEFTAVAKDISPTIVEVHTRGPKSLSMVEKYTIRDANTVKKTIVISNYGRAKQKDLDYGLSWNKTVWEKGLKGTE